MKIVFVTNSVHDSHSIKRIGEFAERGYDYVAYGFKRDIDIPTYYEKYNLKIIGEISNSQSYFSRIPIIYKALKKVVGSYSDSDVLWYFFGLDVALLANMFRLNGKYIYEECDLVHTYLPLKIARSLFERLDKYIIHKSALSVFTSEGFATFHFRNRIDLEKKKYVIIPNRLNPNVENYFFRKEKEIDVNHLSFAFVGGARFDSLLSFTKIILSKYPEHTLHFWGEPVSAYKERFLCLSQKYPNVIFHGKFRNPDDLSMIYNEIDILISTYDAKYENVKYAEPNKIYEAIYFETPIVVTRDTYLADKVQELNIGYVVDPFSEKDVCQLLDGLTVESINEKIISCKKIEKKSCLNINDSFFKMIEIYK